MGDSGIRAGGLTFTSLLGAEAQAGGVAWADWDLSAIVPVGTKYAVIGCHSVTTDTMLEAGVKAKGSGLFRRILIWTAGTAATLPQATVEVEVNAARLIEIYGTNARFGVLGYWK